MTPDGNTKNQLQLELEQLNAEIGQLHDRLTALQQEKVDLEIMLQATTEHSDQILQSLKQQKVDLEILLEATTEHSDSLALELRQIAREERRQREEQFQLITAATPVGLAITQIVGGQFLYTNEMMEKVLGLASQNLLNRNASEFYADLSDRQRVLLTLSQEQQFQGEVLFKRTDGTPFWALLSLRPFRFQGENAILTALYDITDRKQAEQALQRAEQKYRSIFENAVEGIFRSSSNGQYIEVNPAMATMYGFASPQAMCQEITDISQEIYVNAEDRDQFKRLIEEQGEIKDFEYRVYRRDRTVFWISEWARAIRDTQGKLLYYEGSCVDITKRKQEEEALKQQLRELQIEIDHNKRVREVAAIVETDYFQQLQEEVERLRFFEDEE